jgi:hypothetical protein
MGRPKIELKKIHRRKIKKAKQRVKLHLKGEVPYEKLTRRSKNFLRKGKKPKVTSA